MKTFSPTLLTGLLSATHFRPAVLPAEGALRSELRKALWLSDELSPRIDVKASVRFTIEPDHKLTLLDVRSPGVDSSSLIAGTLQNYQVRSESAQPFVIYELDLDY